MRWACARSTGRDRGGDRHRVWVIYITYQGGSHLSIAEAMKYLVWLNNGNVGRHFEALRVAS